MFPPKGYCTCDWIHGLKWNWNSTRFDGVSLWYAWLALATLALDWAHAHRLEVWISLIGWPPFLLGSYRHPHWFSSSHLNILLAYLLRFKLKPNKDQKVTAAPAERQAPQRPKHTTCALTPLGWDMAGDSKIRCRKSCTWTGRHMQRPGEPDFHILTSLTILFIMFLSADLVSHMGFS